MSAPAEQRRCGWWGEGRGNCTLLDGHQGKHEFEALKPQPLRQACGWSPHCSRWPCCACRMLQIAAEVDRVLAVVDGPVVALRGLHAIKAALDTAGKPIDDEAPIDADTGAAILRLLKIGQGNTHQSRRVADFLLAWWNSGSCGGFDFTTLWGCDTAIVDDMVLVFVYIAYNRHYPDSLGFGPQFEAVMQAWRPL